MTLVGLNPAGCGTHSLRRTKVALIYRRKGNLRACQLLLGHTKLESEVRYPGIEADDALVMSEQTDIRLPRLRPSCRRIYPAPSEKGGERLVGMEPKS